MAIGAANYTVGPILPPDADGIMGMAFVQPDSNGLVRQPTCMIAVQDQLPDPIFTPKLHSNTPGSIYFGYVDDNIYTGNLVKMPVDNQTQSSWLTDGVIFGSGGSNLSSKALPLLFNTGGQGTGLREAAAAAAYWAQVQGPSQDSNGNWIYPCNATTPDLDINFPGSGPAMIPRAILNNANESVSSDGTMCLGDRQSQEGGQGNAGDQFFLTFFTVWNQAEPSPSFAPYDNCLFREPLHC
ncbi:MAG: hypothetical protein LQ340_006468 [Diploschistes diacapsis]|nr:MAG: hypothetical protein LQ340_006468 [Diploschistes diacapsis]